MAIAGNQRSSDAPSAAVARLITPPGKGGIAVISLTGPATGEILSAIFRPFGRNAAGVRADAGKPWTDTRQTWSPRRPTPQSVPGLPGRLLLGHIVDEQGRVIDEAIVHTPAPDAAEINIHGGPAASRAVMQLLQRKGASSGEGPGRLAVGSGLSSSSALFTPYSLLPTVLPAAHPQWNNPAIGAEMLELLPSVQSELVLAAVTQQWSAGLSRLAFETIRALSGSSTGTPEKPTAHCPPPAAQSPLTTPHSRLTTSLRRAADGLAKMQRLLKAAEVVLAGPPNAGKSTLANALAGRQVSIVHDTPGTTRDYVRQLALLNGVPVWLTDTAGLWEVPVQGCHDSQEGCHASASFAEACADDARHAAAEIDTEAVRRAREQITRADVIVLLGRLDDEQRRHLNLKLRFIRVAAKCDTISPTMPFDVAISAQTGQGLDELKHRIVEVLGLSDLDLAEPMAFTQRQRDLLLSAAAHLDAGRSDAAVADLRHLLG